MLGYELGVLAQAVGGSAHSTRSPMRRVDGWPTSTAYPATLTSPLDQPDHASRFPRRPIFHQLSRHEPMDWLYPLSGFVVGAIVGLTGMGGGSLMTPLLILLFGVHPLTAVGTDLLYAAVTKTAGTAIHYKNGNVDWRVAGLLAAGSVPATVLTIWVLSRMPAQSPTAAAIFSMSIGVALIIAAVAIFFRRRIRDYALARADNPTRTRYSGPITVVFGALLGVVVSLCSVGAGALGVAVLFFLYPRLPPVRIVGSDLAHAVPLTLVAGLGHWIIGSVDWHIVGALLLGSLPGIYIGSHLAAHIADRFLLPALASMLMLMGLRLIAS